MRVIAVALASAIPMSRAVACAGQENSAQAPPPAPQARPSTGTARPSPVDFEAERRSLKTKIEALEKEGVQAVDLNRARIRIAIVLLNRAIATLQSGGDLNAFDRSKELIAEADSYNVSIDTGVLNEEDRRVYIDLQALSRRAIGEQVIYLRQFLPAGAPSEPPPAAPVPPPDQPVLVYPVSPSLPGCQTITVMPRRCGLFRRFQAR
ncbi:MAG: hypothetical protein ACLQGP_02120 [Isosphaeraceae bacterium]